MLCTIGRARRGLTRVLGLSMKIAAFAFSIVLLGGCASGFSRVADTELLALAAQAEQFIVRHGYTAAGHPPDQPVERVSLYDGLFGEADTVASRKGTMAPSAVCVRPLPNGERLVLFESTKSPGQFWFVSLKQGSNGWVGHQTLYSIPRDCVRVPRAES
jgi:hypothetical protein